MSKTKTMTKTQNPAQGANAPLQIDDLRPARYNPRQIGEKAKAGLAASTSKFGDISGITWNRRTGNLVTAHQRVNDQKEKFGDALRIEPSADDPSRAWLVNPDGERFAIRIVDWPESREKAANVAANNPHIAGSFTAELDNLLREIKLDDDISFDDLRFDDLLGDRTDPTAPDDFNEVDPDGIKTNRECPSCGYRWNDDKK